LITTRTPFRVSFLGGGSDYPEWYLQNGGIVIGGAIDKYSYLMARHLPPYHAFKTRVSHAQVETVMSAGEIRHPAVRAVLHYLGWCGDFEHEPGLEIHHAADLPGRSGTGSSSSFVVGLVNTLSALRGMPMLQYRLAQAAIEVERDVLGETVGCQDQTWAAHGGLNLIRFEPSGAVNLYPIPLGHDGIADLEAHLMLYYTGVSRNSSEVSKGYVARLTTDARYQWAMMQMADEGYTALVRRDWLELGRLMDRAWQLKRGLEGVTTADIDRVYAAARLAGAAGGKLLGAGGGGCLLLVVPAGRRAAVANVMKGSGMVLVPFRFDFDGSRVIFVDRNNLVAPPHSEDKSK
jgi:D-glycero-alpha-D-manno-heptose-7-phosphate kinase